MVVEAWAEHREHRRDVGAPASGHADPHVALGVLQHPVDDGVAARRASESKRRPNAYPPAATTTTRNAEARSTLRRNLAAGRPDAVQTTVKDNDWIDHAQPAWCQRSANGRQGGGNREATQSGFWPPACGHEPRAALRALRRPLPSSQS